jgi:hypothetical protein
MLLQVAPMASAAARDEPPVPSVELANGFNMRALSPFSTLSTAPHVRCAALPFPLVVQG